MRRIVLTNVTVYDIHNFHNTNFHTFIRAKLYLQPIQVLTSRGSILNSGSKGENEIPTRSFRVTKCLILVLSLHEKLHESALNE